LNKDSYRYGDFIRTPVPRIRIVKRNHKFVDTTKFSNLVTCASLSNSALRSYHLDMPTIFYVPLPEIKLGKSYKDIPVIQGKGELCKFLDKVERC
jgi:hypothetical protein